MDFTFTDEQVSLRAAVRDLIARHRTAPATGDPVHNPEFWGALAGLGAVGLPFPEDAGGMGAGPIEAMIVASELGRAGARAPYAEAMVAGTLLGDDDLLAELCHGGALVVSALYEPGRGWSPTPEGVLAEGDRLTGVRSPIPYAAAATHIVTTARAGAAVEIHLVEEPAPTGTALDLAGVRTRRLDADGAGRVRRAVGLGTLVLAAEALGAMETALALTVDYLKSRKQFGVPLASFQTLTQRAADMYTSLELARSTVYFAAMSLADDPDDEATVSRLRVVTGKAGRHIGQEAIQLHGGIGVTAEYAVGHLTARLTAIEHTFGDTRHHLRRLGAAVAGHEAVDVLR